MSYREFYSAPASLVQQATGFVKKRRKSSVSYATTNKKPHRWKWTDAFALSSGLALLWIYVLYWGERTVFSDSVSRCDWRHWEDWVSGLPTQSSCSNH